MNQKKENKINSILIKSRWILPILLWAVLSFFSYEFLCKVEERSYFEFDMFWFREFLNKPSGILSWCSLFFTQFLHIPWLGALFWVILLIASAELTRLLFSIPLNLSVLTYIPAAIFVAFNMSMGYIVYLINLPGYFFLPVLGYLWALLTLSVIRKTKSIATTLSFFVIFGFAGFYIAGFYGLAGILAAGIDIVLSGRNRTYRLSSLGVSILIFLLAPILFVGTTTFNISAGWTVGLPEPVYDLPVSRMQLPLFLAMALLILMPFSKYLNRLSGKKTLIIHSLALFTVLAVPSSFWFRDDNFKAELGMIRAANNLEWEKAVKILEKLQSKHANDASWQPTRVLVVLKDLALIKTGQEGERAFDFDDGSKKQKGKWKVPMSHQIGRIVHLHYGIPGLCNRWCIEETVLFGSNYMTYKYHAMNAILLDDKELAKKYLDKLGRTIFYRKWANDQLLIYTDRGKVAKATPYNQILPLMCYDDIVCADMDGCEYFLMNHFNGIRPENATPLYDRVALYFAMKSKQATLFWTRLFLYLDSNNPKKIARYYQEAAYLFSNIDNKELLDTFPFDEQIKNLYKSFAQNAVKYGEKKLEVARSCFPPNLRHTYYFFYYYVNELQMF